MRKRPVRRPVGWRASLLSVLVLTVLSLPLAALAEEGNEAGLAVQFGDGHVETRCITFEEEVINGAELLVRSGLEVVLDPASSMGVTVCQIEGEGCEVPAEACFCQCMGGGECAYWNYFYRDDGEGEWAYSALGAALRKVGDGSVEAWVWGDGGSPPADELRFETICAAAEAATTSPPELPTPVPATVPPAPAETKPATHPTDLATSGAEDEAKSPTPQTDRASSGEKVSQLTTGANEGGPEKRSALQVQPTDSPVPDSDSGVADYWPFGLMVVALAIVGLVIWRRQS